MLNREMAVIAMSKELGRADGSGVDRSADQQICHKFFSASGEVSDLARNLRAEGFSVFEDDDAPLLEARRREKLDHELLADLVHQMCDLAERFSAEYDGLTVEA